MMRRPPTVNAIPVPYTATISELLDRLQVPGPEAWAAALALGHHPEPEAFQALVDLTEHSDWRFRRVAVEALGAHPLARSAQSHILAALADPSLYVIRTACETVAALQLSEAHSGILALTVDRDRRTREVAVRALSRLWQTTDFETVFEVYQNDPVKEVRRTAAWTLVANVSAANWRALFEAWISAELPRYRVWACEIAGQFADSSAKLQVAALLHDPNGHVRKAAQRALPRNGPAT